MKMKTILSLIALSNIILIESRGSMGGGGSSSNSSSSTTISSVSSRKDPYLDSYSYKSQANRPYRETKYGLEKYNINSNIDKK